MSILPPDVPIRLFDREEEGFMMLTGFGEAGSQYDENVCGVPGMLSIFRLVDDTLKGQYRLANWSNLEMAEEQQCNLLSIFTGPSLERVT